MDQSSEGTKPSQVASILKVSQTVWAHYHHRAEPRAVVAMVLYTIDYAYHACVFNDAGVLVFAESLEGFKKVDG